MYDLQGLIGSNCGYIMYKYEITRQELYNRSVVYSRILEDNTSIEQKCIVKAVRDLIHVRDGFYELKFINYKEAGDLANELSAH